MSSFDDEDYMMNGRLVSCTAVSSDAASKQSKIEKNVQSCASSKAAASGCTSHGVSSGPRSVAAGTSGFDSLSGT